MNEQMNMQKVVELLKELDDYTEFEKEIEIDCAITFLENEMKEKTCDGCKYDFVYNKNDCHCKRAKTEDIYEPKEPTK